MRTLAGRCNEVRHLDFQNLVISQHLAKEHREMEGTATKLRGDVTPHPPPPPPPKVEGLTQQPDADGGRQG